MKNEYKYETKDSSKLTLIPEPSQEKLNQRQLIDYEDHREKMVKWCLNFGKNPEKSEGYSPHTLENRLYRIDQFYRWVWEEKDGYTTSVSVEEADEFIRELAYSDKSNSHKSNTMKALKMLFKWRKHELGGEAWDPDMSFSTDNSQAKDYFTMKEREKLREAALEYGSIPKYNDLSPRQRDKWKAHLAQRFGKPKSEVSPSDWDKANGWKIPSLVWVSLDAGLRPVEVERARMSWIDVENGVLRIPKEESSKNRENWVVALQDRTAEILKKWKGERQVYPKYDESDHVWLTQGRSPYQSQTLKHLLNNLCDIADIETDNRQISWYTIRHSVGTYMTHHEDLGAAQAQLRHKSAETTMKYDQTPIEKRKDALDKMG